MRFLRRLALAFFPETHECPECAHVLPSHRARFHDPNYRGSVIMRRRLSLVKDD